LRISYIVDSVHYLVVFVNYINDVPPSVPVRVFGFVIEQVE